MVFIKHPAQCLACGWYSAILALTVGSDLCKVNLPFPFGSWALPSFPLWYCALGVMFPSRPRSSTIRDVDPLRKHCRMLLAQRCFSRRKKSRYMLSQREVSRSRLSLCPSQEEFEKALVWYESTLKLQPEFVPAKNRIQTIQCHLMLKKGRRSP